jgi:ATP-dependent protease ClpP protease subunit
MKKYLKFRNNDSIESEDDEEEEQFSEIKVINNDIYFYSDITTQSILELTTIIVNTTNKLLHLNILHDIEIPYIKLHINSQGGDVLAAFSILTLIETNRIPIHSIIEGQACSAATLISIVASKRSITSHSYMLIHNLSSSFWGKMHEIEDEMYNLKQLTTKIRNMYKQYSRINVKDLDKLLKKDLLLKPEICKKYGLIDYII